MSPSPVRALAFDERGRLFVGREDGSLAVDGRPLARYRSGVSSLSAIHGWLAVGLLDGQVELWKDSGAVLSLRNPSGCLSVALGPRWLAAGFGDGALQLVELATLADRPGLRLKGHVTGLVFLADGTLAACSPLDHGVTLWRGDETERCGHLDLGRSRCLAARPEGGLVAALDCRLVRWPGQEEHWAPSPVRALTAGAAGCLDGSVWTPTGIRARAASEVLALAQHEALLAYGTLHGELDCLALRSPSSRPW